MEPVMNSWMGLSKLPSPDSKGLWERGMNMERPPGGSRKQFTSPVPEEARGCFCSKPWVQQNPQRKCVKREVCFATDVPGSVARTGCASLFWKHVWALDGLFPPRGLCLPVEIRTKDINSQEMFAGANDLIIAASRPLLHSDFPISASTSALIVLFGSGALDGYS